MVLIMIRMAATGSRSNYKPQTKVKSLCEVPPFRPSQVRQLIILTSVRGITFVSV
jgi:hypothetical protein